MDKKKLALEAAKARLDAVTMVYKAASGHPGGSLSCIDVLTYLYFEEMNVTPETYGDANRDRFVMSKGHCSPAMYSVLAERGYIPVSDLDQFRRIDAHMSGHVEMSIKGVDMSTGSLGQGLSLSCGIAMALKLDKNPAHVFCLLGDGELQEGSCWEAFMHAPHRGLNNVTAIIDKNNLQIDGNVDKIKSVDVLADKLKAFNWNVIEIDGHDIEQIYDALMKSKTSDIPTAIVAKTIKGKGVSFMENQVGWHGKNPNDEECAKALEDLK